MNMQMDMMKANASRGQLAWLLTAAILTTLPHFSYQYMWICGTALAILGLRVYTLYKDIKLNLKWVFGPLVLGFAVAVYFQFDRRFFGIIPGIAYLTLLLALKLHEGTAGRDVRIALFLVFFLQLGLFFNVQDAFSALEAILAAWAATTALVSAYDTQAKPQAQLKTAGLLLLQALPFMLVFFVLFPRISEPLWGQNSLERQGKTGLSETMKLGDVQKLSLSDEIAFRAEFLKDYPESTQRYWRGPVLENFDGQEWSTSLEGFPKERPFFKPEGTALPYVLTLEAHNRPWLLGLDFSVGATNDVTRYSRTFALQSMRLVTERTRLDLIAYPDSKPGLEEDAQNLRRNTRLPSESNPRAQDLARTLVPPGTPAQEALDRIIAHFQRTKYTYTLEPAAVGVHAVDDFLFETKEGFCEHFSSAFVVLARAAGLPARVVTGYLGGEFDAFGKTMVIRQADAHAWAEVWLEGQGWVRVDPTALSAPSRVSQGMAAAQSRPDALPLIMRPELAWLRQLRSHWEGAANVWNQWVLGYDNDRQRELLKRLGFQTPDWRTLVGALSVFVIGMMLGLLGWAYRHRVKRDAIDTVWYQFCKKMQRVGLARQAWEGPFDYGKRLVGVHPERAAQINHIVSIYARLRYSRAPAQTQLAALQRAVSDFNVKA